VAASNANVGGGFIVKDWEQENVRSVGFLGSLEEVEDIVLHAHNGTPVYLSDVAEVTEGYMTRMGAVSRDGQGEVVAGTVIMLKGENSHEVVSRVKASVPIIEQALPDGVRLDVFYDRTDLVREVISTVATALLQGGVLVVLVLFVAVGNLRASLVVACSLPLTALLAFVLMELTAVTANLMSLGGLAIAVGMVVDGSIVVTENIIRRRRLLGDTASESDRSLLAVYVEAVSEVARPISFSILIIILVFLPLFTLEGMEGKMFKPLAMTMIFAMLGALLVSQTVVPVVLSYLLRRREKLDEPRLVGHLRRGYLRMLNRAMDHGRITVSVAVALLVVTLMLATRLGTEFLPRLDEGAIAVNVVRLPNAALDGSVTTSSFMEKEILRFQEVATVVSKTGRAEISEDPMGPEQSDVLIMLKPASEWTTGRSSEELVAALQERLGRIPGLRLSFSQPIALRVNELISGIKADLAVKLFGDDIDLLKEAADEIGAAVRGIEGVGDVSVEQVAGFTSIDIVPDRRAMARYRLSLTELNELVETAIGGTVATQMVEGQMRYGVQVRMAESARAGVEEIERLLLSAPSGAQVPLGQVADIRRVEGPAQISRENSMRRVVVEANIRGRDLGSVVREAQEKLAPLARDLPAGYWVEYGGTFENQQRAMGRLAIVVPASIALIMLMLVSALGSVWTAGLVLAVLPFALVGGLLAMLVSGMSVNVPSTVGFVALFGTAVQNGTVLVTFIDQLRREGSEIREAVLSGCSLRFRALLMTAATTVLGLLPMLFATGSGAEIQRPLAVVVVGGLITATALTLFVLPVIYNWAMPWVARSEGAQE